MHVKNHRCLLFSSICQKNNSNSDHNRDHRKENPSNYRNLWRKKLKAKLIYVRHSLICCHLKTKNRKKTLDIWEQFLWFRAPLGDSWWKKLYFTSCKLTKMMQMSDYVIKTNKNKPKLLYLSFFQFCMLLPKSSHHCSFQVTRHVQTCLPEIIRKSQNNNLPRQSKSLLEKNKITTKQFADLIVCCWLIRTKKYNLQY